MQVLDFLFRVQRFGNQGLSITAAMWSIVVGEVFQSSIESYIVTLIVTGNRCQSLPKDLNSWTHLQYLRGHKLTWVEATWPTLGEVLVFIAARCVYQLPVKSFKYIAALHFWAVPSQHVATSHQPKGQGQCKLHPYKETTRQYWANFAVTVADDVEPLDARNLAVFIFDLVYTKNYRLTVHSHSSWQ